LLARVEKWTFITFRASKGWRELRVFRPLNEISFLGNVAKRLDMGICWDSANMEVTNNPEAEPLIRRPCRKG